MQVASEQVSNVCVSKSFVTFSLKRLAAVPNKRPNEHTVPRCEVAAESFVKVAKHDQLDSMGGTPQKTEDAPTPGKGSFVFRGVVQHESIHTGGGSLFALSGA